MDVTVKAKWVGALRSDEFTQGKNRLASVSPDGRTVKHCCLGVLCELAAREGVVERIQVEGGSAIKFGTIEHYETYSLPVAVIRWAGLEHDIDGVATLHDDGSDPILAQRNDAGETFEEIANLIERRL